MTSTPNVTQRTRLLPVWLWFWLGVYLINLPNQIINLWIPSIQDIFASYYTWSVKTGGQTSLFETLRITNLIELLPYLVVFVGVTTIFIPWLRGVHTERKFGLKASDSTPIIQEISVFVTQYAPNVQIRTNLTRFDQLAMAYPLGFRRPALGIFGSLVKLWRNNRKAAEAVLLHEIAHCREGDFLIVGAGSFFESLISSWVWFYLILLLLPLLLFTGGSIYNLWQQEVEWGIFSFKSMLSHILLLCGNLILNSLMALLLTFSVFSLPLIGIWSAEFNADRFVLETLQSNEDVTQALSYLSREKSRWRQILFGFSHPPARLRRYLSAHYKSLFATGFLILLYPLAYPLRTLIMLMAMQPPQLLISWEQFSQTFHIAIAAAASTITPIFIAMAIWFLIWPLIAPLWIWLFTSSKGNLSWSNYGLYVLGAGLTLLAAIGSSRMARAVNPVEETPTITSTANSHSTIGQAFDLNDQSTQKVAPLETRPEEKVKLHPLHEAIPIKNLILTVNNVGTIYHPALLPKEGQQYITVDLLLENKGSQEVDTDLLFMTTMKVKDLDGHVYEKSIPAMVAAGAKLPHGKIGPGEQAQIVIGYQIPQKMPQLQFIFEFENEKVFVEALIH